MVNAAKAIIKLLMRRGFNAFFIGGKSRTDLHNLFHSSDKVPINNINIITDASKEELKKIFPQVIDKEKNNVNIIFANKSFLISSYEKDNKNLNDIKISMKSYAQQQEVEIINAGNLDLERNNRDFTIDAIVQDNHSNYIDFTYKYNRKDVSAIADVQDGIIRCIFDPYKKFTEDPIRMLRMIRLQSQLGYDIDKKTLNMARGNIHLIAQIPQEQIKNEFNRIITGRFIAKAFNTMLSLNLFDVLIDNQPFMHCLKYVTEETIQQLDSFNKRITFVEEGSKKFNFIDLIDAYTILLSSNKIEDIKQYISFCLDEESINQIIWILRHLDIFVKDDLHHYFFNVKNDDYIQGDRLRLLALIRHIVNIASILENKDTGKYIYDAFCFRPLFAEQLRITDNDIKHYIGEEYVDFIPSIKEAILKRLLDVESDKWPYTYDDYMAYVKLGINDILPNVKVNIKKWNGKIDDYGNSMMHHKAVQHFRVPLNVSKLEDLGLKSFEQLEEIIYTKDNDVRERFQALLNDLDKKARSDRKIKESNIQSNKKGKIEISK